jgi:multiple sugar transport system permease protein
MNRIRLSQQLGIAGSQVFLAVMAVVFLFPFVYMVSLSFKPPQELFVPGLHLIPDQPTLQNYLTAVERAPIFRYLLNGVIVCLGILLLQLLIIIPAGFAFAYLDFAHKKLLFGLVLIALVVPGYITAIPNFLLMSRLGLMDSYWALILPFIGSSFGTFLMRQFYLQIPKEIFEAAVLDGASTAQLIHHVIVPLTKPAIAAFSIFSLLTHWNDFFWPSVVVQSNQMYTPPAGIVYFANAEGSAQIGVVMAAAVIVIAPLATAYLLASKQFIESFTHTGVKG